MTIFTLIAIQERKVLSFSFLSSHGGARFNPIRYMTSQPNPVSVNQADDTAKKDETFIQVETANDATTVTNSSSSSTRRRRQPLPPIMPTPNDFPSWSFQPRDFFRFELLHQSTKSQARVGRIHTPHGIIDTPGFVAVATGSWNERRIRCCTNKSVCGRATICCGPKNWA